MQEPTFDCLVIGLAQLLRPPASGMQSLYPYPELYHRATNLLALTMPHGRYPRTLTGLLSLAQQPLRDWWPGPLPVGFNAESGLLYEGGLSEEASHYLYEELSQRESLSDYLQAGLREVAIENDDFRRLLERLYQEDDRIKAQKDYVRLRGFLIASDFTTPPRLREAFSTTLITPDEVGRLYEQELPPGDYWACASCGPLTWKGPVLRGIRPGNCDDHSPESPKVRVVSYVPGLMRLRYGIHFRICHPGIPELRLFEQLENLRDQSPDQLLRVDRWPGLDTYDARLEFRDGSVWAVDVKTHVNPHRLEGKLAPIRGVDSLRYDRAFYVFPHERLAARAGYLDIIRETNPLPDDHELLSDTNLLTSVTARIAQLKRR